METDDDYVPKMPPMLKPKKFSGNRRPKTTERGYNYMHQKQRKNEMQKKPLCERCGLNWSHHLHHRNRNPFDRRPENIEMLCVKCHKAEHK